MLAPRTKWALTRPMQRYVSRVWHLLRYYLHRLYAMQGHNAVRSVGKRPSQTVQHLRSRGTFGKDRVCRASYLIPPPLRRHLSLNGRVRVDDCQIHGRPIHNRHLLLRSLPAFLPFHDLTSDTSPATLRSRRPDHRIGLHTRPPLTTRHIFFTIPLGAINLCTW